MPGTHYDNDCSFIEELPFEYRKAAALFIREYSFKQLLQAQLELSHPFFDEAAESYPSSHPELMPRTLQAVLVAKITFFAKDCFISDAEFAWIESMLYRLIATLIARPDLAAHRKMLLREIQSSHYKSFEWLTRPRDETKRYSLEIRKRRFNDRRYFRYRADLTHHFVRLGNHEMEDVFLPDIKTTGINHFSEMVNAHLDQVSQEYAQLIELALLKNNKLIHQVFEDYFAQYQDLREILNGISLGVLGIDDAKNKLKHNLQMSPDYEVLKNSQVTLGLLKDFWHKLEQITQNTLILLEHSSPHTLYQGPPLEPLKVDQDIKKYRKTFEENHSHLLGAFLKLYDFSAQLERIYNNIASGEFIIMFPEYWVDDYKNISGGGFAFYSEFEVFMHDILEIMIRINTSKDPEQPHYEILKQKAKVLRIEPDPQGKRYLIACQFLLTEEKNLKLINYAIQALEIHEALAYAKS